MQINCRRVILIIALCFCRDRSESSTSCRSSDDKFKSTESLPAVKTTRLSVPPCSDDELSSSQPNVCVSGSPATETELKSSRVQTPSSGTFTADEEELKGTVLGVVESRRPDSTDEDSSSAGSFDDPGPRGRPRPADHRWRSLDRRATSGDWDTRRRSTDRILESPELSKRVATRVRSADSRSAACPAIATDAPTARPISDRSPPSDADVVRGTGSDEDDGKTTEDLTLDIDSALAEVMSEIESLGLSHVMFGGDTVKSEEITPRSPSTYHKMQTSSFNVTRQDFEDAPDLVIGLPTSSTGPQSSPKNLSTDQQQTEQQMSSESTSSSDSISSSSAGQVTSPSRSLTAAEVFANANQCTIKKAAAAAPSPSTDRTSALPSTSSVDAAPSSSRPTPACRARSVDTATVLASESGQRSSSPPARKPCPVPKAKPLRRSDIASKPFPTPADIRPDVEFVRAIVPPFGDSDVVSRTFTLPRDSDMARGRPDPGGSRSEVSRSMSVGDATATVDLSSLRPQPASARDPSPTTKPPVKVKPPVMKKPARAGEVIKRLQESLAQQGGVGVSAPQ